LNNSHKISVYEHESLYSTKGESRINEDQLKALQHFYKEKDFPYYTLIHNGVKFSEYVGIIQVGSLTIEVLPKADNNGFVFWRTILLNMLRSTNCIELHAPTKTNAELAKNSILDLYIDLFLFDAEMILHRGLIKSYKKIANNQNSLKGRLVFNKHVSINLIRQERFFVNYTVYDKENLLNNIIYKTLLLIKSINSDINRTSKIYSLIAQFPELPFIQVDEKTFSSIQYNRKTENYRDAIEIARLILLNYHPDLSSGSNNVLSIMFNMNQLWERFILLSLKRCCNNSLNVIAQNSSLFWKRNSGNSKKIRPDILITDSSGNKLVIDTKWKNINDLNPSDSDLRQMYVYSKFNFDANAILVYPGIENKYISGNFYSSDNNNNLSNVECGIMTIMPLLNIREWQKQISILIESRI
jgi:5-methylcytosine-specific restriction enzyme subunit McrC